MGWRTPNRDGNAAVEACVGALSQTIASLPLRHLRTLPNGGTQVVNNSPATRVLRKPNAYQTRADFILNLVRHEQLSGNGYAGARRGPDGKIISLHPLPATTQPYVGADGSVFYAIGAGSDPLTPEPTVDRFLPARDVLHTRLHCPSHPLVGESPILAASLAIESANAIGSHLSAFFRNMTRPSGYLSSPKPLKSEQATQLREMWESAYSAENSGRVAVLFDGLEWKPMSITSVDAQLIESYKMTVEDVARVFRVPLAIIGVMGGATYSNTETLIRHWLASGLGYVIEHIELALDALFELPPEEYIAFDVEYLLRADFAARIEGLVKGVQGGLFSPNEAREKEGLPAVEHGDEPRLQAQVVPLSFAGKVPVAPSAPATPAEPVKATPDYLGMLRSLNDAA
jgi:HK97 family phage portal protein